MNFGDSLLLCLFVLPLAASSDVCQLHYRAFSGEVFMMPCDKWSRLDQHMETKSYFAQFKAETAHSGIYACLTSGGWRILHLQVVNKTMECSRDEENTVTLELNTGGSITCPGHNCNYSSTIVWYKGNRSVANLRNVRPIYVTKEQQLYLDVVMERDNAVFFCDRELSEQGVKWNIRRSVIVKAVEYDKYHPRIHCPENNTVQEVELGRDYTLRCEAYFPEADPPEDVRWFMNSSSHVVNLTMEKLEVKKVERELQVIRKAILRKVTAQDLNRTYTCIAQNASGKNKASVFLKKKNPEQWSSLVEYALGPLLLVTGLAIVLRVKWLEIQLILKSRWTLTKTDVDDKDFDVLLSFVGRKSSMVLASPQGQRKDDGAFPLSSIPLAEDTPSEKLELQLPHVLEDLWGYRLCLLERDYLPGGAYTNDVADALQKSKMLICLLSAEYLSDKNAVFVLESGVQALLRNTGIRLLLIWTNTPPVSSLHQDQSLPVIVQRAVKVLPALAWTSSTNSNFWRNLRKAMPHQRFSALPKSSRRFL